MVKKTYATKFQLIHSKSHKDSTIREILHRQLKAYR